MTTDATLVHARVVTDPGRALETALDRELAGYAVLVPQDSLLFADDGHGLIAFDAGVPTRVYHTGTTRGGAEALADLAQPGPYKVELYGTADPPVPDGEQFRVSATLPAERLAGDSVLAERTADAAAAVPTVEAVSPPMDDAETDGLAAIEAFLADEEKIAAIQAQAREEAERRADEWGFEEFADG